MNSDNYNYESPITRIENQLLEEMVKNEEDQFVCKVRQAIGYNIDKAELIKALNYDRDQYERGYQDGRSAASRRGISMTLQEFIEKAFRNPASKESVKIYVFDDEDSADSWIEYKYNGAENYGFEIAMVIQSDYRAEVFLKDKWLNAEIQQFYVVEADTIAVVVNVEA